MIGLLWFDEQKRPITAELIAELAAYCQERRGFTPKLAQVNPGELTEETVLAGVKVQPNKHVMKNNVFLVMPEEWDAAASD